jgi:hypothetical protein
MRPTVYLCIIGSACALTVSAPASSQSVSASSPQQVAVAPSQPARTAAEAIEYRRLSREQAEFARWQLEQNRISHEQYVERMKFYEDEKSRLELEHRAAIASYETSWAQYEAEKRRNAQEYDRAVKDWRSRVRSCKAGNFAACD